MKRFLLLATTVLLMGPSCVTPGQTVRSESDQTLMVYNGTGTHIGVYVDGTKIGTATAGRNCLTIPRALPQGPVRIRFNATAWPPVEIEERLQSYQHWEVDLDSPYPQGLVYDVLSLKPAAQGCVRKMI